MNLLVLVANYPNLDGGLSLMYVHVRNKYYLKHGINVTVLNFSAKESYIIDGIQVITLNDYVKLNSKTYNILVCHAPNIRNHYLFLKKYSNRFNKIVFFFHGHEVLKLNKVYPEPYSYVKNNYIKNKVIDLYDEFKLKTWNRYFKKIAYKSHFVFVSEWIYKEFLKWTKTDEKIIMNKHSIINNSIGETFEKESYDKFKEKKYDFITIRTGLDPSKYGVDIVNELAKTNKELEFLVIGKGEFFNHNDKPQNVTWLNTILTHEDMIDLINNSKCALLPTRQDTQGVMTCEMATFGIPVITSNIEVCHEIFDGFDNVKLIDNENCNIDLKIILKDLTSRKYKKNTKYYQDQTIKKEVNLYRNLIDNK